MGFMRWRVERLEALERCRFLPLVCMACGHITERETPTASDDLEDLLDLVREFRETREEWALLERARVLFERFPDSLHPARVRGLSLSLPNGSKGEPDPEFEAAMRQDLELAEFLCPSQGYNSGYSAGRQAAVAESIPFYEKLLSERPALHCPACHSPALEIPESFILEQMMARRQQRAVLARKLKEEGQYPCFGEVCCTHDPARYYTDANDHNPLVLLECHLCEGSGLSKYEPEEPCPSCLGVGIVSDEPTQRFDEEVILMVVPVTEEGLLTCPNCRDRFNIHDPTEWTGLRHQLCGQKILPRREDSPDSQL